MLEVSIASELIPVTVAHEPLVGDNSLARNRTSVKAAYCSFLP